MQPFLQGLISDYLASKRIEGGFDFAQEASRRLAKVDLSDNGALSSAIKGIDTSIFRANSHINKSNVIDELVSLISKKVKNMPAISESQNTCRILFMASNPRDEARLAIDEEVRSVQNKLKTTTHRASVVLEICPAARPDDFIQLMNEKEPHVLHFSGHGGKVVGIALSNDQSESVFMSPEAVDRLFSSLKGEIRLVVLNSCYSEAQAKSITKHIDCVIGMNDTIQDAAAADFAASLYRAIGFGKSVQNAFDQAMASLSMNAPSQENIPVLLYKQGIKPDEIYLVKAAGK